jgi:hypothetical protein
MALGVLQASWPIANKRALSMHDFKFADLMLAVLLMATASVLVQPRGSVPPAPPVRAVTAPTRT